jgi:hypothetical protein
LHGDQCKNQKKRLSGFVVGFAFIAIPTDQCFGVLAIRLVCFESPVEFVFAAN